MPQHGGNIRTAGACESRASGHCGEVGYSPYPSAVQPRLRRSGPAAGAQARHGSAVQTWRPGITGVSPHCVGAGGHSCPGAHRRRRTGHDGETRHGCTAARPGRVWCGRRAHPHRAEPARRGFSWPGRADRARRERLVSRFQDVVCPRADAEAHCFPQVRERVHITSQTGYGPAERPGQIPGS